MCTAVEPASHGQEARSGAGSQSAPRRPMIPAPTEIATVSSSLSVDALRSAFQVACSNAATSTAEVTASDISTLRDFQALAEDLLDERRHALDRGVALRDRFPAAVILHGAEVRQERRDEHVGRVASEAAPRHALLD